MVYSFSTATASQRLRESAGCRIDLSQLTDLESRATQLKFTAASLTLNATFQKVTPKQVALLHQLAREASSLEKFKAMVSGETVNCTRGEGNEARMALHTASRDIFADKPELVSSEPALQATCDAKKEHSKLENYINSLEKSGTLHLLTHVVQIGIGGSELGPKTAYMALKGSKKQTVSVHFAASVDLNSLEQITNEIDLATTLFIVVSKSGSTIETACNEEYFRSKLENAGLKPENQMVAVTSPGSAMDCPARYAEIFYVYNYVGGRYSTTSMVGGVVLSVALGLSTYLELLKGAHAMDHATLNTPVEYNLALNSALFAIWNREYLQYESEAIIAYDSSLSILPSHLQQVFMESNGKSVSLDGVKVNYNTSQLVWGGEGTNVQHSFFQQLHQGTQEVPVEFVARIAPSTLKGLKQGEKSHSTILLANALAQQIALAFGSSEGNCANKQFDGNRPSSLVSYEALTPFTMGALLSYYEHKATFQGFIWGINSFDQEGVQLGKRLATTILRVAGHTHEKEGKSSKLDASAFSYINSL